MKRVSDDTRARDGGEAAAVWVDRASLKPWARNPRKNDEAAKKVAESIKRFGFAAPIVARKADGEVIAGHTRLKAAEILGLPKVPVRFVDLDPAEAHLLALADNKLGEVADWDDAAVAAILSEYSLDDAELAGWDSKELDKLASELGADGESVEPELDGMTYSVVIDCKDEREQTMLLERLDAEGYKCRPLIL